MSKSLIYLLAFSLVLGMAGNWQPTCQADWPDNVGLLFGAQGIEPGNPSQGEAPPGKTNWYVDADAPNGGNGSYANPYNSFEQVCGWMNGGSYVQGQIQGGDYLYVKGTFEASDHAEGSNNMNIRIGRAAQAGTASEPTVIKSWLGSPRAVFDCEYQKSDIIHLHSNTNPGGHFVIQNIEVKRASGRGVYIADNILGCEVISSVIRDTHGDGNIGVGGGILFCFWTNEPHHVIRNSLVYNNDVSPVGTSNNRGGISILSEDTVQNGASIDIYQNEIYDECHAVRHKHSGNVICYVYNNIIHDSSSSVYVRSYAGNYIHHNIIYDLSTAFMVVPENQQSDQYTEFYNNTVYNVRKLLNLGIGQPPNNYLREINVHDNIYYNNVETSDLVIQLGQYSGDEYPIGQWESSYNTYYYLSSRTTFLYAVPNAYSFTAAGVYLGDSTMFTFDPLFVDAPNLDFHLQPTSPALGAGTGGGDLGALGESGTPQPPGQASNPSPGNGATSVSASANLSWTAGSGKTSSDVYFGTDSTPDSGEFQGNQTTTTFDPGTMSNNTTYYWRIDEINAEGTTTGTVWNFTTESAPTPPGQASSPSPANSATGVSMAANLSWTAGSGATSHDVYFGTDSTPDSGEFQGNQPSTSFDPGTMDGVTTYYWRIDEVNAAATTTGTVWNFTTEAGGAPVTKEFGDATNTDYPGTIEDTYTNAGSSSTNFSTDVTLNTYTWPADTVANTTIIKWDLSAIPTGATVTEATLYLYQVETAGDTSYDVPVHKIINVNPVISSLTWNTYDGTNSWTGGADGGQSDTAAAEDTPAVNSTNNQYKTWSVTNMVADWVTTPSSNYGMLLNSDDVASVDSHRFFASNEVANASTRPKLIVTYSTGAAPPGQASNPAPANSATDIAVDTDLSWTAGSGATSRDVYFGTTSPGTFQGNQTATTFDTGTMANDTTYYWRIDEINAEGTTTGNVWSFTTIAAMPSQASNPSPADSASNISINTDLSWTAGSGATSHDVYFGTSSPGAFQGNQIATTFDPGTLNYDMTYYWRIDEINAAGTTTGNVWTFTTEAAPQPPGQATNPDPANSATGVSIAEDLSWTAGTGSDSSDVYFGTTSPGAFQGNQTATNYDPETMDYDTTYYWRIDEININGTTTGVVWSFTTETSGGQVTEEFGDAADTNHPGTIEDTYTNVGSGGDDNWSTDVTLNTYTWPADTVANTTIIKWDLSAIPTNATVINATLYLYQVETAGDTSYDIPVHKITGVNPVINACTWNTYNGTNSWTGGADGGQSDIASAEDTHAVNATNNVYKTWSVTNMVADWVAAPANNYGMLLNSDDVASVDSHRTFASTEAVGSSTRPKLIVTYSTGASPPGQASNPSPANTAAGVSVNADLSWSAGSGSTSSDVYFGTDSTPDSTEFKGNQTATTYDPGTLANDTTYYWRIDEVNANGTTTGAVWNFTTVGSAPSQATNPSPANSATNVSVDADLSWTAGAGATSHDVYGGTDPTPDETEFIGNLTATTLEPGTLINSTTYYWRIDEVNAAGTTAGTVWSFTTEAAPSPPGQASNPSPANSATGVSVTADLNWTAGSGATSHDVYFGTSSPGASQGNQAATTYDTGTMSNDTTYYWRIDEVNSGGTTTGTVWSFTTEPKDGCGAAPMYREGLTNVSAISSMGNAALPLLPSLLALGLWAALRRRKEH